MKKILTSLAIVAALMCAAATGVFAKNLNPYEGIYTMEHDSSPEAIEEGKLPDNYISKNGYVGDLGSGGLVYRNVDFGTLTPKKFILNAGIVGHATVNFRLDKMNGPVLATVRLTPTGSWGTVKAFETDILLDDVSGVHDVWLVISGNARMFSFEILPEEYDREPIVLYDGTGNFPEGISEEDKFYCQLIGGLGFKSGSKDEIDPNLTVSRGTFASFIDWAMNYLADGEKYFTDVADNHAHYEAITRLKKYNIISGYGDMTFKPDQAITGEEAATICANALGYNKFSKNDYESKKSQLITQSGIKNANEPISTLTAMKMLYKFFKSEYVYMGITGINSFESYEKKNILEYTRDIYLETGIVDGNVFGMLDNPQDSTSTGQVSVKGEIMNAMNSGAERFLGRNCEYFVYRNDNADTAEILSIAPDKKSSNKIVTDEEEPYVQNGTLYYTENNKTKKIRLSNNTRVVYNAVSYENVAMSQILNMQNLKYENGAWVSNGSTPRDFKGTIEALSYSGGDTPDVIFVNFYENIVVSGYDKGESLLRDKLSDRSYFITGSQDTSYATIFLNNEPASYRDIKEDMTGIIYKSINNKGKCVVRAYFFDNAIEGTINSKGTEKIKINGVEYDIAEDLKNVKNLYVGMSGKFFVNPYNEVIWVIASGTDSSRERLVTFIKGVYDEDNDEVLLTVWDMEEGIKKYPVKDKIDIEGVRANNNYQIMNGAGGYTNIGVAALKRGWLLKIKLNADGKIIFIDSQLVAEDNEKDCVKMVSEAIEGEGLVYRPLAGVFGSNTAGNKYPFVDDAILIKSHVPSSEEYENGEGFTVTTLNTLDQQDNARDFVLYSTEYGTRVASVVIWYEYKTIQYDKYTLWMFEDVGEEVLGRNDEAYQTIVLNEDGMSKNYYVSQELSKTTDFSTFVPGTVLKVALNAYNEVVAVQKLFVPGSNDGFVNENNPENESYINSSLRVIWAEIDERDNSFLKLIKRKGAIETVEYIKTAEIPVYICKTTSRGTQVTKSDQSALTDGKKALFVLDYGKVKQAIIYQ